MFNHGTELKSFPFSGGNLSNGPQRVFLDNSDRFFKNFLLWEVLDLKPCEVSCQLDHLEKAGNTIYPIKKVLVRAAKSRPGQIDPYIHHKL